MYFIMGIIDKEIRIEVIEYHKYIQADVISQSPIYRYDYSNV